MIPSISQHDLERGIRTRVSGESLYQDEKRLAAIRARDRESMRLGAQLVQDGRIDEEHRIKIPPLYPAYLLLDLPRPRRPDVRRVIEARGRTYEMETVTGLVSTVIRLTCREAELGALLEDCLANGARDAKGLLVLARDRRSA